MENYFKIKLLTNLRDNCLLNVQQKHDDENIIITCGNNVLIQKPTSLLEPRVSWSLSKSSESYTCPVVYCPVSKHLVSVKNNTELELRNQAGELVRSLTLPKPVHCLLSPEDSEPLVVWAHGAVQSLPAVLKSQPVPAGCLDDAAQLAALAHCVNGGGVYLVASREQTLELHHLEVDQPTATMQKLESQNGAPPVAACHLPSTGVLFLWASGDLSTSTRFLTNLGSRCLSMAALQQKAIAVLKQHKDELKVEVWDLEACLQTNVISLQNQDGSQLSYMKGHLIVAGRKGIHRLLLSSSEPARISALVGSRKRCRSESPTNQRKKKRKSNHHHTEGDDDIQQLMVKPAESLQGLSQEKATQLILSCLQLNGSLFPPPPRNGVPYRPDLAKPHYFKRILSVINIDPYLVCRKASQQDLKILIECLSEGLQMADRSDYQQVYNLVMWTQSALRCCSSHHNLQEQLHSLLSLVDFFLNQYKTTEETNVQELQSI